MSTSRAARSSDSHRGAGGVRGTGRRRRGVPVRRHVPPSAPRELAYARVAREAERVACTCPTSDGGRPARGANFGPRVDEVVGSSTHAGASGSSPLASLMLVANDALPDERRRRAGADDHARERVVEARPSRRGSDRATRSARGAGLRRPPVRERREVREIVVRVADPFDDRDLPGLERARELGQVRVQPDRAVEVDGIVDTSVGRRRPVVRVGVRDDGAEPVVATGQLDEHDGAALASPRSSATVAAATAAQRASPRCRARSASPAATAARDAPRPAQELAAAELLIEIARSRPCVTPPRTRATTTSECEPPGGVGLATSRPMRVRSLDVEQREPREQIVELSRDRRARSDTPTAGRTCARAGAARGGACPSGSRPTLGGTNGT